MDKQEGRLYEFSAFLLDARERRLTRDGRAVPLTPKAFDLLLALVERSGRMLVKDELMRRVWPDQFVEESNLAQNISTLRKALGETRRQKFIETVPRHGYRFAAEVREGGDGLWVREHTRTSVLVEEEEIGDEGEAAPVYEAEGAAVGGEKVIRGTPSPALPGEAPTAGRAAARKSRPGGVRSARRSSPRSA